jgi:hypothetical protein
MTSPTVASVGSESLKALQGQMDWRVFRLCTAEQPSCLKALGLSEKGRRTRLPVGLMTIFSCWLKLWVKEKTFGYGMGVCYSEDREGRWQFEVKARCDKHHFYAVSYSQTCLNP